MLGHAASLLYSWERPVLYYNTEARAAAGVLLSTAPTRQQSVEHPKLGTAGMRCMHRPSTAGSSSGYAGPTLCYSGML